MLKNSFLNVPIRKMNKLIYQWKDLVYVSQICGENGPHSNVREVKIRRFRCTGTSSMILVINILVDVCTYTRN